MKYTLFCEPGENLRAGFHGLLLGSWLPAADNRVILVHGNITEGKARDLIKTRKVAIFRDCRFHILSIEGYYSNGYRRRVEDTELNQFVGWLYQAGSNKFFKGVLNL